MTYSVILILASFPFYDSPFREPVEAQRPPVVCLPPQVWEFTYKIDEDAYHVARETPPLVILSAKGCVSCQSWKKHCLPKLKERGWRSNRHYEIKMDRQEQHAVPQFHWKGRQFQLGFDYRRPKQTTNEWMEALKHAMGKD